MEKDITEYLEAEEEWCELLGEGEQRNAEVNVDEHHVSNFSEDEEKDSYSEAGRTVDERRLEKIKTAPRLTTKRKDKSFLKLFNSYRDKFPSFAAISAPLRDLISKGQPNKIKWGEAQDRAFAEAHVKLRTLFRICRLVESIDGLKCLLYIFLGTFTCVA